jgi:N-methylhydantoinase A
MPGSGLPVRVDGIEMLEIGAAGGSIARLDQAGWISVGPESAGASPGPACYGLGGREPTVTDANLLLGYLDPGRFAGGAIPLSRDLAEGAIADLSEALAVNTTAMAAGILAMINAQMADALRLHIVERGGNPGEVVVVAFGGGGPLHGYDVARLAGCRRIIVPPRAGIASAIGLLLAPPAVERSRTLHHIVGDQGADDLSRAITELVSATSSELTDRYGSDAVNLTCFAEMSYLGQGHEIVVSLPDAVVADSSVMPDNDRHIRDCFEKEYKSRGAGLMPAISIQLTRVTVRGELHAFVPSMPEAVALEVRPATARRRAVYYPESKAFLDTAIVRRETMVAGAPLAGPVLIEEDETTTVVGPSASATIDSLGNLIVTLFAL